jgi:hypothetical protein
MGSFMHPLKKKLDSDREKVESRRSDIPRPIHMYGKYLFSGEERRAATVLPPRTVRGVYFNERYIFVQGKL